MGAGVAGAQDDAAAMVPDGGVSIEAPAGGSVSGALVVEGGASPAHAAMTLLYRYDPASRSAAVDIVNDAQVAGAGKLTGAVVVGPPTYRYDDAAQPARTNTSRRAGFLAPNTTPGDECGDLTLFRAVEPAELGQIIGDGFVYRVADGMSDGKYFSRHRCRLQTSLGSTPIGTTR